MAANLNQVEQQTYYFEHPSDARISKNQYH
jgi:hypothetical protein